MRIGGISPYGYGSTLSYGAINGENSKVNATSAPEECQTCKSRKYQDGSNEMVSFKSAAHISPEASAARVRAHEGEHVSNAYDNAAKDPNTKVISAGVSLKTAICPECGRTYVAGGETRTMTMTRTPAEESNPYAKAAREMLGNELKGSMIDEAV